jgi:hypothetical protein
VARTPLRCGDLVTESKILAAVHGPNSPASRSVTRTSTAEGSVTGEKAIQGAGGLSCSWKVGADSRPASTATFTVSLLPQAAREWTPMLSGDAPTTSRRTFAAVSAAADCADAGCAASAPIGSAWVRVDLTVTGLGEGQSVYGDESTAAIFRGARPAIAAVFTSVKRATAAQLRFPSHVGPTPSASDCRNYLKTVPLARAMGVGSATYGTPRRPDGTSDSIAGAAEHRIGVSVCYADGSGTGPNSLARITIAPLQSWAVTAMAADPTARGGLTPVTLTGQTAGEHALTNCSGAGTPCTVVFALGTAAIQIDDTTRAKQIAEAIIAEAR